MPDLVNENTGHPVKYEFQINKHTVLKCISVITWDILILKSIIYLKFKFKWASCILSGNPRWMRHHTHEIKQEA